MVVKIPVLLRSFGSNTPPLGAKIEFSFAKLFSKASKIPRLLAAGIFLLTLIQIFHQQLYSFNGAVVFKGFHETAFSIEPSRFGLVPDFNFLV